MIEPQNDPYRFSFFYMTLLGYLRKYIIVDEEFRQEKKFHDKGFLRDPISIS